MFLRIPFFGLLSQSPMKGLIEHYDKIAQCIDLIYEALECYITGGACKAMEELAEAVGDVEREADNIKRRIRNHLPRRLFMSVDKTLFLNYTNKQDNILDNAQEALNWLAMRQVNTPEEYKKALTEILDGVKQSAHTLGPALKATIKLVDGSSIDREGTKNAYRKVRGWRSIVRDRATDLTRRIYNSDMEFKDIYQLIHFVDCLNAMSHDASNCADILRAMIAR